jgi:hypothetical protein
MLLPDPENDPEYVRAELKVVQAALGDDPTIADLRAARQRLSPRVRAYLHAQAIRATVTEEALRMIASGELPDVRFDDTDDPTTPVDRPEQQHQL